ncbi:hypothetical protein [Mycolicibacterium porcinum]
MTETKQPPGIVPWAQFRDEMLTSREVRRKAVLDALRRFVEANPTINQRPRLKAVLEARLQLREDLVTARFQFRRTVVHNLSQLRIALFSADANGDHPGPQRETPA